MAVIGGRVFTDDELALLHLVAAEHMQANRDWNLLVEPPDDREGSVDIIRHRKAKFEAARKLMAATVPIVDAKRE